MSIPLKLLRIPCDQSNQSNLAPQEDRNKRQWGRRLVGTEGRPFRRFYRSRSFARVGCIVENLVDDDDMDASLSQLRVSELLLEALTLDRRLRNDPQCPPVVTRRSRDHLLERAASIERSAAVAGENMAVRIKTLIHGVEVARADVSNTDSSSREVAAILQTHLGGDATSAASWNLLGCLKVPYDVDGALQSFHKSHELDPTRRGRNPSQSTTRLFVVNESQLIAYPSLIASHFRQGPCSTWRNASSLSGIVLAP
jgi:hypothetical protein